jgi:hypothetical protein
MSQETSRIRTYLEENPKWIGILFAAMMLLSQVGTVAAEPIGSSTMGP